MKPLQCGHIFSDGSDVAAGTDPLYNNDLPVGECLSVPGLVSDTTDDSDKLLKAVDECLGDSSYNSKAAESLNEAKKQIDSMNQELVRYLL